MVPLAVVEFGGHVRRSAHVGVIDTFTVTAFLLGGESEVDDLKLVLIVEKNIFRLQIAMTEAS